MQFTPRSIALLKEQARNKTNRIIAISLLLVFAALTLTSEPKSSIAFSSGTGAVDDPYIIANCAELQSINDDPEYMLASYELSGNIDCSSISPFTPIGVFQNFDGNYLPFMGRFDGQGFTISNVTMGTSGDRNIAIFAATAGASIRNVVLDNVIVTASNYGGTLIGESDATSVVGVSVINSSVTVHGTGALYSGGVIGRFSSSYGYGIQVASTSVTAVNSSTNSSAGYIGGLAGQLLRSTLDRSAVEATVAASFFHVGGISGSLAVGSVIKDSYSGSVVTGYSMVGGVLGSFNGSGGNDYVIHNVYSNASTTGTLATARVGGIVGGKNGASSAGITISNSFAVGPVSSTTLSAGIIGTFATLTLDNNVYSQTGTGQTRCTDGGSFSASECTFNNTSSYYYSSTNEPLASWDFSSIWEEFGGALPELRVFPFTEPSSATAVATCTDLATNMRADPNGWFTLANDIDCAGDASLLPLLGNTASTSAFVGIFDGQNFTISNITMSRSAPSPQYLGGFGLFTKLFGATVSSLNMTGGGVTSLSGDLDGIGGLAGFGEGLVVRGVTSTVPVNTGDNYGGGLIGWGSGFYENINVLADIDYTFGSGAPYGVGGIIGYSRSLAISSSTYAGNIRSYTNTGGIVGLSEVLIANNVSSTGTVSGGSNVGGIVGFADDTVNLTSSITNATSTMSVGPNFSVDNSFFSAGGILGQGDRVVVEGASYNGTIDMGVGYGSSVGGFAGDFGGTTRGSSTASNIIVDAAVFATGSNGNDPYLQRVGGFIGGIGSYVELSDVAASTTMLFGADTPSEYINGVFAVGGFAGSSNNSPVTMNNIEAIGSLTIYDDYTGISGGYAYGIGGFIGSGANNIISSATSSIDLFLKSYESGAIGGLAGEGGNFSLTDVNVLGSVTVQDPGSTYDVGGFIGYSYGNSIATSSARGDVTLLDTYGPYEIGGLLGVSYDDVVSQTYTDNTLTINMGNDGTSTGYNIGGFLGAVSGSTMTDTYASTTVNITSSTIGNDAATDVGGYAGYVYGFGTADTFTNSYSSGSLSLVADSSAPFRRVGGFIGSSNENIEIFTDNFTVTAIPAIASSTQVGAFIGSYNGGETFSNNAFDATVTGQSLCTGIDGVDPAWCTARNVGGSEPNYFYSSANAPQSAWDFSSIWLVRTLDYPVFGAGVSSGPSSPSVTTDSPATAITQTSATIEGEITNLGSGTVTTRGFVHGATPMFGATTTESSAGFSTGTFSTGLTGLVCNTTYYFAAYASSTDGLTYGSTESFTTSACSVGGTAPSVSTNAAATAVSRTGATLAGSLTSLGTASVTARGFVYGTGPVFGATTTENSAGFTTGSFSRSVSNLNCGQTYNYAAYASSADGTSYGNTQILTTSSCSSGSATRVTPDSTDVDTEDDIETQAPPMIVSPVIQTPQPAVPTVPVVTPPSIEEDSPVEVCDVRSNATTMRTTLDTSLVSVTVPDQALNSRQAETSGVGEYSVYLRVNKLNGKGVEKQLDKFVALLSTIAEKRETGDKLPPGLVKKVGEVTYVAPTVNNILTTTGQPSGDINNIEALFQTKEIQVSNSPCDDEDSTISPVVVPEPPAELAPELPPEDPVEREIISILDEDTGETVVVTDVIVGEEIANYDLSAIASTTPSLLLSPFEVTVSDEFGNVLDSFDKPAEIVISDQQILGLSANDIYIVKLSDDGVSWFEVPFSIEGDSIRLTVTEPGKYFIWRIPKAIAAEDESLVTPPQAPFTLDLPLWIVELLTVLGITSGIGLLTMLLSKIPFSVTHARRVSAQAVHNLIGLITFKKKRKPWGTVYDSVTKAPVDPAYVELFDTDGNKQAEAITDLDGRYGFLAPEGTYTMNVRKTNYSFPSKIQKVSKQDIIYSNLYQGGPFSISSTVAHDIPMDPQVFDWNQAEKIRTNQTKFFKRFDPFVVQLLDLFFFLGVIAVVVQVLANTNVYTVIIAALYLVLLAARLYGGKPLLFGSILKDNQALQFALVKIYKDEREVATKVTDKYGRYIAILEPGTYEVRVEERVGEDEYQTVLERTIKTKNGTLNKNLKL